MIRTLSWRSAAIGAAGMLLVLAVVALLTIETGGYDVAADARHETPVEWALTTTMRNSVQARAADLEAPAFTDAMVAAGAGEYKAMCQHCHGGVGAARAEWAHGMRPMPPALAGAADEWAPREIFWIVKHGIKMTGMPAFGGSHDDPTLWNIAAFVAALPAMDAARYAAYPADHGEAAGGEGGHAH